MRPISEVHNEDCMIGMSRYPDKFWDLAIVDPPYGIGASDYQRGGTQYGKSAATCKAYTRKNWDSAAPSENYFDELFRVSKNQIIWGANHFLEMTSPCWIVWDKENGENGYADCELAWTSFKSAVRKVKHRWHGMLQKDMKNKEERIHPTQKPVGLYKWILTEYAHPGDKILDTHMGSQSSRIAAFNMGFDYWGFEIDPDYYKQGCKRFEEQTKQQSLFGYGH
jgi:site-specific DNA-methyltransferase (adenine-specific)